LIKEIDFKKMNEEFKNLKEDSEIYFIKTKDKLQILI
jgi:hypothetical protein